MKAITVYEDTTDSFNKELNKIFSEHKNCDIDVKYSTTCNEHGYNVRHQALVIIKEKENLKL
jgi:hypothetical protein